MSDRGSIASYNEARLPISERPTYVYRSGPEPLQPGEVNIRDVWETLKRRWRTILVSLVVVISLVAAWTIQATPVWNANTLLQVEERDNGLLATPALTALTGIGGAGSQIETELRILRTRPIAEDVVEKLNLNFVVTDPRGLAREKLFETIEVGRQTVADRFEIRAVGEDRYRIVSTNDDTPDLSVEFAAGERVEIPGGSFVLADLAHATDAHGNPLPTSVDFVTLLFQRAVKSLFEHSSASRPDREANVLQVSYRTTDPVLVYEVPNTMAATFIRRRTAVNKRDARSTVAFIQAQVDTTRAQLTAAEDSLRVFQQDEQMVAIEAEAEAQVEQLAQLQMRRTQLDTERTALRKLLNDIDAGAIPDYRRLASFPTFFQNQAVATMLSSLVQADSAKSSLLARLTPNHPDVVTVQARIGQLEEQLGSIGTNYMQSLDNQIGAIDEELDRFRGELENVPERQITFARIRRQVEMLGDLYRTLQTRLKEAQVQEAIDDSTVRVVEEAIAPLEPLSPKPLRNLAVGLALGFSLGILLALVREYLDGRLHGTDNFEAMFGLPTMARIPRSASSQERDGRLVALLEAESMTAESYRTLRTNVALLQRGGAGHVILLTSPGTGEGRSVTAANLAVTLARQGQRTLLIDADLRRPSQHERFELPQAPGLSDFLLNEAQLEVVLRTVLRLERLSILPAGQRSHNSAELLNCPKMDEALASLRGQFDTIVIDAPPLLAVTDSAVLAPKTDGVILVVRAEKTHKDAIGLAIHQLRQVDADILGVVVTDAKGEGSYQSYYDEYFGMSRPPGLKGLIQRVTRVFS